MLVSREVWRVRRCISGCSVAVPSCALFCFVLMSCRLLMCRCFAPRRSAAPFKKNCSKMQPKTAPKSCLVSQWQRHLLGRLIFRCALKNAMTRAKQFTAGARLTVRSLFSSWTCQKYWVACDAKHCTICTSTLTKNDKGNRMFWIEAGCHRELMWYKGRRLSHRETQQVFATTSRSSQICKMRGFAGKSSRCREC